MGKGHRTVGCEAEIDDKGREGLEVKGRDTSSALPHHLPRSSYILQRKQNQRKGAVEKGITQWNFSWNKAPPNPGHFWVAVERYVLSSLLQPPCPRQTVHWAPSRPAVEELALGWLAGGHRREIPPFESHTFSRGKQTVKGIQSTRNTSQSIKQALRFAVASSVDTVLPFGIASARFHALFVCRDMQ